MVRLQIQKSTTKQRVCGTEGESLRVIAGPKIERQKSRGKTAHEKRESRRWQQEGAQQHAGGLYLRGWGQGNEKWGSRSKRKEVETRQVAVPQAHNAGKRKQKSVIRLAAVESKSYVDLAACALLGTKVHQQHQGAG